MSPTLQLTSYTGQPVVMNIRQETSTAGKVSLVLDVNAGQPLMFWKYPDDLISNLLDIYMSYIEFTVTYAIIDGQPLSDLKAYLRTSYGTVLTQSFVTFSQQEDTTLR